MSGLWTKLTMLFGILLASGLSILSVTSPITPVAINLPPAITMRPGVDQHPQIQAVGNGLRTPESIAVGADLQLYTGASDGWVYRQPLPSENRSEKESWKPFAETGGYVIGMEFSDKTQSFWAANFPLGLQEITLDGVVSLVAETAEGTSIEFADDLTIASDGTVYFTDASVKFNPLTQNPDEPYVLWELLEGTANGRMLAYDPKTGEQHVLLGDLYFPSGISLSPDGDYLLFVEVSRYRVMRYWLAGDKIGATEVFSDALPGIPDDVHITAGGAIWITLVAPRDGFLDAVAYPSPLIRRLLTGLPNTLLSSMEKPTDGASIARLSDKGDITCRYPLPDGVTAANIIERNGLLYAGVLQGEAPFKITPSGDC